jgi:hypothetical protein
MPAGQTPIVAVIMALNGHVLRCRYRKEPQMAYWLPIIAGDNAILNLVRDFRNTVAFQSLRSLTVAAPIRTERVSKRCFAEGPPFRSDRDEGFPGRKSVVWFTPYNALAAGSGDSHGAPRSALHYLARTVRIGSRTSDCHASSTVVIERDAEGYSLHSPSLSQSRWRAAGRFSLPRRPQPAFVPRRTGKL